MDAAAATVSVADVPVMLVDGGVTVMPLGTPLTAMATGSVYPLIRVSETVTGVLPPCCMLTGDGTTANENEGTVELNVAVTTLLRTGRGVNVHVRAASLHTAPDQTDQPRTCCRPQAPP
jgi:hypothetical protein